MTSGDIRPGDRFEIEVKVTDYNDTQCKIELDMYQFWIAKAALLAGRRIERPLQVGDRVKAKNMSLVGTIIELIGPKACVKFTEGDETIGYREFRLIDLERVPASEGGGT